MSRTNEQEEALLRALRRIVHTDRVMSLEQARTYCRVIGLPADGLDDPT